MITFTIAQQPYEIDQRTTGGLGLVQYRLWTIRDGRRGRIADMSAPTVDAICHYLSSIYPTMPEAEICAHVRRHP